jgi:hypothetical protein
MDLKDQDPPTNPIAMAAVEGKTYTKTKANDRTNNSSSNKSGNRDKNWKYAPPKTGKAETKYVKSKDGTNKKDPWCGRKQCKRWTLSHNTEGHGQKDTVATGRKPPKAKDMKLQSSLKTFLASTKGSKKKLPAKECQQLQLLLTTMNHSKDSDATASVNLE